MNYHNTVDQKSQTTSLKSDKGRSKLKVARQQPSTPSNDHGKGLNQDDKNTQRTSIFAEKPPMNPTKVPSKQKTSRDQPKSPQKKPKPQSFDLNAIQSRDMKEDPVKQPQLSERDAQE